MDKIVCLGDSITFGYSPYNHEQVKANYPDYIQNKYRDSYEIINSGNVGWQTKQTLKHVKDLCLDYNPKYCLLMLGINDARGSKQGLPLSKRKYRKYLSELIDMILTSGTTVILLSPTTVFNKRVDKFAQISLELANEKQVHFVDTRIIVKQIVAENNITLAKLLPDHVHFADEYYTILGQKIYENVNKYIL